ncbi:MAG: hypothetical protein ACKVQJ_03690 [Pyrinomonadaceae bacterium]
MTPSSEIFGALSLKSICTRRTYNNIDAIRKAVTFHAPDYFPLTLLILDYWLNGSRVGVFTDKMKGVHVNRETILAPKTQLSP